MNQELISVLILTDNEGGNIVSLLRATTSVLGGHRFNYEIIIVDTEFDDDTVAAAQGCGAQVAMQSKKGYGNALREGLALCKGDYVATLDAGLSHDPKVLLEMLARRHEADVVIASRYVRFGHADMPASRRLLSVLLNKIYTFVLDLPLKDVSSGYRLYRRRMLEDLNLVSEDFDLLPEVIAQAYASGYRVTEVPFHYHPTQSGKQRSKLLHLGLSYFKTLFRYWKVRNSIASADYDYRAFHSRHPVQRYWQRRRYAIVTGFVEDYELGADVGCGSSMILESLPNVIGVDISRKKLRFIRGHSTRPLICGDVRRMPFADRSFDLLICSQVIEHLPRDVKIFDEFQRLLKPGGTLILGTPDYAKLAWRVIEWLYKRLAPNGYGDEHISHYTLNDLTALLEQYGFEILDHAYICDGELIVKAKRLE